MKNANRLKDVLGFVGLDFLTVRYILKFLGPAMVLFLVLDLVMEANMIVVPLTFVLFVFALTSYPFQDEWRCGMTFLYGTLPLRRETVVLGRYLFSVVVEVLAAVCAIIYGGIVFLRAGDFTRLQMYVGSLSFLLPLMSFCIGVQYPALFALGYNKGKIMSLIPYLVFTSAGVAMVAVMPVIGITQGEMNLSPWFFTLVRFLTAFPYVPPLGGLVFLGGSCLLSLRLYARRDL